MRKTVLAFSLFIALPSTAQMENIDYESTEVAPGFYMTVGNNPDGPFGGGTSGFIVTEDYVALVDDGLPPPAPAMVSHIVDVAGKAPDFLINTHYHGDHTGANALFAGEGTVIFAHHALRERLLDSYVRRCARAVLDDVAGGERARASPDLLARWRHVVRHWCLEQVRLCGHRGVCADIVEALRQCLGFFRGAAVMDYHACAGIVQSRHDRGADAPRGSCDERSFVVECRFGHHCRPF